MINPEFFPIVAFVLDIFYNTQPLIGINNFISNLEGIHRFYIIINNGHRVKSLLCRASISFSVIEDIMSDQAGCFENTRDFPNEETPLGYRLRSPLLPSRNHARSAFLTVFSITQPALFIFINLEILLCADLTDKSRFINILPLRLKRRHEKNFPTQQKKEKKNSRLFSPNEN
jgi:hypothetical protein